MNNNKNKNIMSNFKSFLTCMLLTVLGIGNVWGEEVVIWSENWSGVSANATPSAGVSGTNKGNASYTLTNGKGSSAGTTKIYEDNLAGGTSPELMIGKKGTGSGAAGGSWAITLSSLENCSGTLTLNYKINQSIFVSTSVGNTSSSSLAKTTTSTTITNVPIGTRNITITITAATTNNVRIDDVSLVGSGSTKTSVSAPTNLQTSNLSQTGVTLSWDAPTTTTGIASYKAEYKTTSAQDWTTVQNTSATSCTLSNLTPATEYQWRVTSIASDANAYNDSESASGTNFTTDSYTVTAQSNKTELGTVSGTTIITASPKECVGYASPAYTVTGGTADVNQSGNTFTVSNMSANVTVTINFAAKQVDHFVDHIHSNAQVDKCGDGYTIPTLDDATPGEGCEGEHYHFVGWSSETISTGAETEPDGLLKAGDTHNANGTTYYAVWAREE